MLIFNKDLEGKRIFIIGIGNTARGDKGKVRTATVVRVKPKNVVICVEGQSIEKQLRRHDNITDYGNHLVDSCNGGYACYESEGDIAKERYAEAKLRKVRDILSGFGAHNPEKKLQDVLNVISEVGGE